MGTTPLTKQLPSPGDGVAEALLRRLQALGLKISTLKEGEFVVVDENRVGMRHVDATGQDRGQIWLNPQPILGTGIYLYDSETQCAHFSRAGDRRLILCESLIDSLFVAQGLRSTVPQGQYTVASTASWGAQTWEWENDVWWGRFDKILVVGTPDFAAKVQLTARKSIRVLASIANGGGWESLNSPEWMADWLQGGLPLQFHDDGYFGTKYESYSPVSIDGAYFRGHLHYAVTLLERQCYLVDDDAGGSEIMQPTRRVIRVVKSDGTLQRISQDPAPPGTREEDRIYRLEDQTIIDRIPTPANRSWSSESILAYVQGQTTVRPLRHLLADVILVLRSRVWLPNEPDYYVLALAAVASYLQGVFDSVPLLLACGRPGTGKSQLGIALASIAANGAIISRASAATISRLIDQNRGFVVLDDLEEAAAAKNQGAYTELIQGLKVCYNQATATRDITEGGRQIKLNYYGIKLINNTRGVDEILGTRMLRFATGKKPAGVSLPKCTIDTDRLRDEIHTWAFTNVGLVAKAYADLPTVADRSEEITAPLRTLAHLAGDKTFEENLDAHLSPPSNRSDPDVPDYLRKVMNELVRQGETFVCPSDVVAEIGKLMAEDGKRVPKDLTPSWIGSLLRTEGYLSSIDKKSKRVRKEGKFLRMYRLTQENIQTQQNGSTILSDVESYEI